MNCIYLNACVLPADILTELGFNHGFFTLFWIVDSESGGWGDCGLSEWMEKVTMERMRGKLSGLWFQEVPQFLRMKSFWSTAA